ncbi:MAG TPA: aminoacetone oxidase family FAD-binding enzyme [Candidatus Kapabacteria bacterium]|nr:aminoacetone oxidase family FAD-binding enzyme [Candidatus Kapabacteria bacterium]
MTDSIAIVGGGAGGIFAALAARKAANDAGANFDVHLFERNPRPGIKILISGGGKCNITHAGPVEELLREGFPRLNEQRFLKRAMYRYTNADVLALLARHGVACHARENGRIFPDSGRAEDVLAAFERELRAVGVILNAKSRVESIRYSTGGWQITHNGKQADHQALILATGGTSYSKTGTTGDGIHFAAQLGHCIVPVRSALAPIYLKHPPVQNVVGIALQNAEIYVVKSGDIHSSGKILAQTRGDILITHRGLSGPATLGISNAAAKLHEAGPISIEVNLVGNSEQATRDRLISEQQARPLQQCTTWLEEVLPNRFVPFVLAQAEVPNERRWNALTREERNRLVWALTRYGFGAVAEIPLERGEVTSGGVALAEVDPKTMMSRLLPGLFFAGEMLDVAGEIGGYNLQAAYSTGWVAGEAAASRVECGDPNSHLGFATFGQTQADMSRGGESGLNASD